MGANNASAQSLLKQDYREECDLKEACGMAVKVLSKTMDSTKLSSEKSEYPCDVTENAPRFSVMWTRRDIIQKKKLTRSTVEFATVGKTKDGAIYHHLWSGDEIMSLLKEHGLAKEEEADSG